MKKLLLLMLSMAPAAYAEVTKTGATTSKTVESAAKPALNKEKLQELEQKIKAAEKKYHESVQATENAKKNNASKDEVTRLEGEQEKAKAEWQKEKSVK